MLSDLVRENVGIRGTYYDGKEKSNFAIIDSTYDEVGLKDHSIFSDCYVKGYGNFSEQDIIESALTKVIFHPKSGRNVIQEYDEAIIYYFRKLSEFEISTQEEVTSEVYYDNTKKVSKEGNLIDVIKEKREIFITRTRRVLAEIKLLYRRGELLIY